MWKCDKSNYSSKNSAVENKFLNNFQGSLQSGL